MSSVESRGAKPPKKQKGPGRRGPRQENTSGSSFRKPGPAAK